MMKWIIAALAAIALGACAKSSEPSAGSQTHFLSSCEDGCAAPYECLCGVCTLPCDEDATCSRQAEGATCVDPEGSCEERSMMCDVECSEHAECSAVGVAHVCTGGRCREPDGQAGEGGVGGTSGGGGSGGAGGSGGSGGMGGVSGTGVTSGGTGGAPSELGEICDGSADMRLGYTIEGGFVDITFYFTNPYGHRFLFIDGRCNYYASSDYLQGVVTGTITEEFAANIAEGVEWNAIDALIVRDEESCPDAGGTAIWVPGGRQVYCTCGCDEGPVSQRKTDALQYMQGVSDMLIQGGTPLSGPVSALAALEEPFGAETLAWPLAQPLSAIDNLVHDLNSLGTEFALFEDLDDAAALRGLRAAGEPGTPVHVTDGVGTYVLFVRDEFPDGVQDAIDALRETALP